MQQSTGIAIILGFWASFYLLDAYLKANHRTQYWYISFLNRTGLSVSVGQLRWYTGSLNRLFLRLGQIKPHFLKQWFNCGVVFGLIMMVLSICLLTLLVFNTLQSKPVEQQVLTPVMPGVNLPMNQIVYYLLTLLVCGILHEFGHALAAVREQVRVNGFGIFIVAVYPGAFVDMCTEHLQSVSPLRQLRIYCAGIWHNFVIVIVAIAVLFLMPWIMSPVYHTGSSIVITQVKENSPVSGPRGLVVGDEITSINGCRITSVADWIQCVTVSMSEQSTGFCMPQDVIKQMDVSPYSYTTAMGNVECCVNASATHLCFSYHTKALATDQFACLPARSTTERPPCKLQSDCYNPNNPTLCVTPSLDNSTKLLRVVRTNKPPLLFLGYPLDMHYAVMMSDYVPIYSFVPINIPYVVETFSKYLISLSGALAILNVVPCYALDGQWILMGFIEYGLRSIIPSAETRGLIYTVILLFGTLLLFSNVTLAMWMLFR